MSSIESNAFLGIRSLKINSEIQHIPNNSFKNRNSLIRMGLNTYKLRSIRSSAFVHL